MIQIKDLIHTAVNKLQPAVVTIPTVDLNFKYWKKEAKPGKGKYVSGQRP